ncbi:MAG: HEAT repeat domain-containing protein [Candidatus Omnitrophica bacterium]|nr:HEAT repeat domain-containing protein [Candidatus Omnitrophota bacterium]
MIGKSMKATLLVIAGVIILFFAWLKVTAHLNHKAAQLTAGTLSGEISAQESEQKIKTIKSILAVIDPIGSLRKRSEIVKSSKAMEIEVAFAEGRISRKEYEALKSGRTPPPLLKPEIQGWEKKRSFERMASGEAVQEGLSTPSALAKREKELGPAIEVLIPKLQDSDPAVRAETAEILGKMGARQALEPLLRLALRDNYAEVREKAARALSKIGDYRVFDPLIEALKDESLDVRAAAALALGYIGDPKAIKSLIQAAKNAKDGEWDVIRKVIIALGSIGSNNKEEVDFLVENLQNTGNPALRKAASDSLIKIAKAPALTEAGQAPYLIAGLISALQNDSPQVRNIAADTLKRIGGRQVIGPLILTLGDKHNKALSEIEGMLQGMKDDGVFPAMIDSLKSDNPVMRLNLVRMMGDIRDPLFFDAVVRMLGDGDKDVRAATISALAKFGDPRATGPLCDILINGRDMEIRIAAAMALGETGDSRAVGPLVKSALTESPEGALVPDIGEMMIDVYGQLRLAAVDALRKIGGNEAITELTEALNSENPKVREMAAQALDNLRGGQ